MEIHKYRSTIIAQRNHLITYTPTLIMLPSSASVPLPRQKTAVFLQKSCVQHRYIRSRDTSSIVERPERLRAVHVGLAAAAARLEETFTTQQSPNTNAVARQYAQVQETEADELASALGRLNLANPANSATARHGPVQFVHSDAFADILNNAAVKFIHGDVEGDVYLENLKRWAAESGANIDKGESEIPEVLSQGDLYRTLFRIHFSVLWVHNTFCIKYAQSRCSRYKAL